MTKRTWNLSISCPRRPAPFKWRQILCYLVPLVAVHVPGGVSKGMLACVKNGTYKGDLEQVVDVNNARRRSTIKLIPRLDLQALLAKFGGGSALKKAAIPDPRLIHSSELEEFRLLIRCKRDRETGEVYEFLDDLMLKTYESKVLEWLSQLYGEHKRKRHESS